MINLNINNMKGSEILVIQAAVVKAMEKTNFQAKEIQCELMEAKTEGNLVMVFVVENVTSDEISNLQREFGTGFTMKLLGKSKSDIFLQLEAPRDKFMELSRRYTYTESAKPYQAH